MGIVKGQGQIVGPVTKWFASFAFHINETNNSWDTAILKFDLEKSKVKFMGAVKGQGHKIHPLFNWCTFSFHVNRTNQSWDIVNRVFDLEKNILKLFFFLNH